MTSHAGKISLLPVFTYQYLLFIFGNTTLLKSQEKRLYIQTECPCIIIQY